MALEDLIRAGRFPPTSIAMPDVPCDDTLFLRYWVALQWEGQDWLTSEQKWTLANHARLTDKAVREYRAARECLSDFVTAERSPAAPDRTPDGVSIAAIQRYMRSADHLENCVNAVKRSGRYHSFFLKHSGVDPSAFDDVFSPIKTFRDDIEHFERDLERGVGAGEPMFVTVLADAVYLNERELTYDALASAIESLHLIAGHLIDAAAGTAPADPSGTRLPT